MSRIWMGTLLLAVVVAGVAAFAQKDNEGPTCWMNFVVVKEENGRPVRNAAVIMHPVGAGGKQQRGGMELKTNSEGKTEFDGVPYGMLRVQVLAQGFQTYGEDFDIEKPKMEVTIKLKRPSGQYSIYDDHAKDSAPPAKQDAPPADSKDKKPN